MSNLTVEQLNALKPHLRDNIRVQLKDLEHGANKMALTGSQLFFVSTTPKGWDLPITLGHIKGQLLDVL